MLIGKHKMAPVLSPKKSVEGGIGGILGAELIGALYALAINRWGNADAEMLTYVIIGAAGGGDLPDRRSEAASAIKRYHNIKDYGKLIPDTAGSWTGLTVSFLLRRSYIILQSYCDPLKYSSRDLTEDPHGCTLKMRCMCK